MNGFKNVYEDEIRALEYNTLEFPGTYYLAYRDLSKIIKKHVTGNQALDFGCGTGRSTRFLKNLGFETIGIDNSKKMIEFAGKNDPSGNYIMIDNKDFGKLKQSYYDLILSVFTFDNIPDKDNRADYLKSFRQLIKDKGKIILLDSTPEIYMNEWLSFTTKDFPENRNAISGDKVKIILKDVADKRPVEDIIWFNDDYMNLFQECNLKPENIYRPLGKDSDNFTWVNEKRIAPWVVYVLKKYKEII